MNPSIELPQKNQLVMKGKYPSTGAPSHPPSSRGPWSLRMEAPKRRRTRRGPGDPMEDSSPEGILSQVLIVIKWDYNGISRDFMVI